MTRPALLLPVLCTVVFAACGGSTTPDPVQPQPVQGEDAFSTNSLARYDRLAVADTGAWRITDGRLTATGPAIQSVMVRKDASFANGSVETIATRADDGGLVLRFTSEGSYYLLAFRDDSAPEPFPVQNLAVYRRFGTRFEEIARGDITWPRGTPRTIRFGILGGVLSVYVDGELIGQVTDPQPLAGGRVGVRHYGDDDTWITVFDSFRWREGVD